MRSPERSPGISASNTPSVITPPSRPALGGFRTVHVEAKAKGYNKLIVRTKTGYYPNTKSKTAPATVPVSEPHASN